MLGAGGVLGGAWTTGTLEVLQSELRVELGKAEIIVGTSAGSVLAAGLRCGLTIADFAAVQRGDCPAWVPSLAVAHLCGSLIPPLPQLRLGSPRLLLTAARAPGSVHPWVIASACLPLGRRSHHVLEAAVRQMIAAAAQDKHGRRRSSSEGRIWPTAGQTWIVAVDYDSGSPVAFGRRDAPAASLPDAVVASCSIPGWFKPTVIGDRHYVDGGVRSPASADLLVGAELDEVYVLAPAAGSAEGVTRNPWAWPGHRVRAAMTSALHREVSALRSTGTAVVVLTPARDDLAAMGINPMDHARAREVYETALTTSARSLRQARSKSSMAAGAA